MLQPYNLPISHSRAGGNPDNQIILRNAKTKPKAFLIKPLDSRLRENDGISV